MSLPTRACLNLGKLMKVWQDIVGRRFSFVKAARTITQPTDLMHYYRLVNEKRIIELDFPVEPRSRSWSQSPHMRRLLLNFEKDREQYGACLASFLSYEANFLSISIDEGTDKLQPHWVNGWLPGLDAISLYAFVAQKNPRTFLEVGSGNSTKFVRKAISDHGLRTKIISIDPQPRAEIDEICDKIYRTGLENTDLRIFDELQPDDVLFIDNSHRSFPNSDVTVFFLEVLGRLPAGLLYGIHDIFLPVDYPEDWGPRFYNEQYLLAAYLFGGADGDKIVLPGSFVSRDAPLVAVLDRLWKAPSLNGILPFGGCFWMTKGNRLPQ